MNKIFLKILYFASLVTLLACSGENNTRAETVQQCIVSDELRLHVPSPDWRDQVVYMLFIDRFDDGDDSNNDQGFDEFDPEKPTHYSGGDLQGVIDRIGYLKSLGVSAVWVSPPVANQWWSTPYQATGWHGYWAADFKSVDAHFGTLDDYKRLSHELHCNGMYLIQDIVANHTANWYTYDGNYNPDDTAANFRLLEPDSFQPAPSQVPFNKVDRLNPEHAAADVYHWTPTVQDYGDMYQQYNYMFGFLADLNTENPVVVSALQDSYKFWIEQVGVDAFRIDTVSFAPLRFWSQFLNDENGIYAHARSLGKESFLTFGEAIYLPEPYEDESEQKTVAYQGDDATPGVNSMLAFPLYYSINRVIGQGSPTAYLDYRLRKHMEHFPDPYTTPIFVDNHDTARFLSAGPGSALKQALATIFTLPGIPILYQGTEQGLLETRMAMFAGGHHNAKGSFDSESDYFRFISELAELRRNHPVLTRGELKIIASNESGPGVFAYRRDYQGESVVILMNTANHTVLAKDIDVGAAAQQSFDTMFAVNFEESIVADKLGKLSFLLPPRALVVMRASETVLESPSTSEPIEIAIAGPQSGGAYSRDFELAGTTSSPELPLQLVMNGDMDRTIEFSSNSDGAWSINVPVRDYGETQNYLEVYAPTSGSLSERFDYAGVVSEPALSLTIADASDDAFGPRGDYIIPQQQLSGQQREIESLRARAAGRNLEIVLTMKEVSSAWKPPHGFDNVAFTTFFSFPERPGARGLPMLNSTMPGDLTWDLAHFGSGWISYAFASAGSTDDRQGEKLGVSPKIIADRENRTVTMLFDGNRLGIEDWSGVSVYVTTWEVSGEGVYVDMQPEPSDWFFGGGDPGDPKIMDDMLLKLEGNNDFTR